MFSSSLDYSFSSAIQYGVIGHAVNAAIWAGLNYPQFFPRSEADFGVHGCGVITGMVFGAILPYAHLIRKPIQSLGVNRDIQDLTHLIVQFAFPIFYNVAVFTIGEKLGFRKAAYTQLIPYMLFDEVMFSLMLLSSDRWKDLKEVIIPGLKKI